VYQKQIVRGRNIWAARERENQCQSIEQWADYWRMKLGQEDRPRLPCSIDTWVLLYVFWA
jgi:hypothetical protein